MRIAVYNLSRMKRVEFGQKNRYSQATRNLKKGASTCNRYGEVGKIVNKDVKKPLSLEPDQ